MINDSATQGQLQSEWQDIRARLTKLDAEATRRQAEIATVWQTIAKLEATVIGGTGNDTYLLGLQLFTRRP